DFTRKAIEKAAGGTTRTRISRGSLEKLLLPTPPLVEQEKIAAILATVDNKLDIIARQIEATQTLKRGLMQTLFSRGVGTQDGNGRWVPHTEFKDSELGRFRSGGLRTSLVRV
ncbi:restriction endonuclease subunit S, partial [Pseudomonas aeruginosa]